MLGMSQESWMIKKNSLFHILSIFFFINLNTFLLSSTEWEKQKLMILNDNQVLGKFNVEIAKTPYQLQKGLMYRKHLDEMSGMLFVFEKIGEKSFWMKNTFISLDIIFINDYGKILTIHENTIPFSEKPLKGEGETKYVLEINSGLSKKYKILEGYQVLHPIIQKKSLKKCN